MPNNNDLENAWKDDDVIEKAEVSDEDKQQYENRLNHEADMKPFHKTAFGRTLSGKNKPGRWIHGVIDVAPIPNVHEVLKAVIKDEEAEGKAIGSFDLIKETFKRLDWTRTIVGVLLVVGFIFDYISIEKAEQLLNLLSGIL